MDETTFDKHSAAEHHDAILQDVQKIRNGLSVDVIDYYWSRYPENEADVRLQKEGMRKYLIIASERIHELLNGKLY